MTAVQIAPERTPERAIGRPRMARIGILIGTAAFVAFALLALGAFGDDNAWVAWNVGPLPALLVVLGVALSVQPDRRRGYAYFGLGVGGLALGALSVWNPWNLGAVDVVFTFGFWIPAWCFVVGAADATLISIRSNRWPAVAAIAGIVAVVGGGVVLYAWLVFVAVGGRGPVTFSVTSPDGTYVVGVESAADYRTRSNPLFVRTGSGPFRRERIIASAGTEDLMIIRFTGPGTFTAKIDYVPCTREFSINVETLEDSNPTGLSPTRSWDAPCQR